MRTVEMKVSGKSIYAGPGKKGVEARSLALHHFIADKLRKDPGLFDCVKATIKRWHKIVCENSQRYVMEWERLTEQGLEACLAVALEESERATTLRQCSPFGCVLTPRERYEFMNEWKRNYET